MKLLKRYVKYDVARLVREFNLQKEILANWYQQANEITEISAVNYDGVGGSGKISDRTFDVANERLAIDSRIKEYETDIKAIERALSLLGDKEQVIIKGLSDNVAPDSICKKLHIEKTTYYNIRNDALKELEILLYG